MHYLINQGWLIVLFGCAVLTAFSTNGRAQGFAETVQEYEVEAAMLKQLVNNSSPSPQLEKQRQTLQELTEQLASAILWPVVKPGNLVKIPSYLRRSKQSGIKMESTVSFVPNPVKSRSVDAILNRLKSLRGKGKSACFGGPKGVVGQIQLSRLGYDTILEGLNTTAADIKSVKYMVVTVNNKRLRLSERTLGKDLFRAMYKRAAKNKSITLRISPMPRLSPVRLSLMTVKGERVTMPVTLEGASRHLKVKQGSVWKVSGGGTAGKVNIGIPHQMLLASWLLETGSLEVKNAAARVDHLKKEDPWSIKLYDVHLHGAAKAWFAYEPYKVKSTYTVQKHQNNCDLYVEFLPSEESTRLTLPALPLKTWKKVTHVTVLDPDYETAEIGFLDGPACTAIVK